MFTETINIRSNIRYIFHRVVQEQHEISVSLPFHFHSVSPSLVIRPIGPLRRVVATASAYVVTFFQDKFISFKQMRAKVELCGIAQ